MKRRGVKIFILACIAVPIMLFMAQVDFVIVLQELRKIGAKFIVILLITFVAYMLGTIGWWVCLGTERSRISVWQLFGVRQVGETVGLYNPSSVVGGDMLKNELLKPYFISHSIASESVVISRITAVLSQLLLFILSLCWVAVTRSIQLETFWSYGLLMLIAVLFSIKILFFYLLCQKRARVTKTKLCSRSLWQRFCAGVRHLSAGAQDFFRQHTSLFWWSYFFFFLHWLAGSMEFYFILRFLDYDIQLIQGVLLDMGVIMIKSAGAFIPGQFGIEELGNKIVLASVGIQAGAIWVTVSILRRARQLCWILVGMACYICVRKSNRVKVFRHGNPVR